MSDDFLCPTGLTPEKYLKDIPNSNLSPGSLLLFTPSGHTPPRCLSSPQLDPSSLVTKTKNKGGRPSFHRRFPELVPAVDNQIKSTGYKAAQKRDTEVGQAVGCRLEDLTKVAVAEVGGLESISRNTIHRLMVAPDKRFKVIYTFVSIL